ncbi:MAG TPA: SGNH/GDSL hydrolase family protein [Bryobacteraceae bacterium]|nr:SGNH/GDSL hydrolase family protein [Bryobacteraceae bacterium]
MPYKTFGLALFACGLAAAAAPAEHWVATWGTAEQMVANGGAGGRGASGRPTTGIIPTQQPPAPAPGKPGRRFPIPPTLAGIDNQTVRMIIRSSMGGSRVRVRLSNAAGGSSVMLGAAHIALRAKDSAIVAGSDHALTFSGKPTATIYAGQVLVSDPVDLKIAPLTDVAVSLYFPRQTSAATNHRFSLHDTYISKDGDFTGAASIADPSAVVQSYYYLAGLDVAAPANAGTVVTFGDSITDGDQSSGNTNSEWPAVLAARLQANKATAHIAVVNAGISGNRILGDNGGGMARFFHDALNEPGVKWITLLEGINDITAGARQTGPNAFSEADLIAAYRQVIAMAHEAGVKVIGCTLTPFGGSSAYSDRGEEIREAANKFIRSSGEFDAVIDFEAAVRDPDDPKRYRKEADSPDLLHPGDAGYKIMGDSINLKLFQ